MEGSDYDSDEESVNLLDVSSDVEINPDELDGLSDDEECVIPKLLILPPLTFYFHSRFEEIDDDAPAEKPATGKKHPRESDAMETDAAADKKATKKQKAGDGSAVPLNGEAKPAESKKEKKKKEKEKKEKAESTSPEKKEGAEKKAGGELKELPGGLKVKDVKVGTGKQAKAGNTVSMR